MSGVAHDRLVLGGRFKLIRHLGGGGMSEVFVAEQLSLARQVALKVLKRDFAKQPEMAERFRREALLLSTVDHPSVVRVIDFDSGRDGTVLVLELAEGETLEQTLADGPLEPRRAIRLLAQLAEGLAAIHDKGIIHRDLKPHNVVITPGPRGEQARLLDFGIARLMEITDEGKTPPTLPVLGDFDPNASPFVSHPGQAVGTPAYVAPEQATASPMDARTDVYSFGVLAFRVLAGRLPFEGTDTRDFLEQHVRRPAPALDEIAPHLASWRELVKLVKQCLEKKPDARPKDGQALAEALKRTSPPDTAALTTQTRRAIGALTTHTWKGVQSTATSVGKRSVRGARLAVRLARKVTPEVRRSLLITALVVACVPAAWAFMPPTPVERLEKLLRGGHAAEALELVDRELPDAKGDRPVLLSLKAAALHRLGRPDAERLLLRDSPYQTLHVADPLLLEALAEDWADQEGDAFLAEMLAIVPAETLDPAFTELAGEPPSLRQWGALRYLDTANRAGALELVRRYAASLASTNCPVRVKAARRLAELGDLEAIGALRELAETPKDEVKDALIDCGQDEAGDAIRALKRKH